RLTRKSTMQVSPLKLFTRWMCVALLSVGLGAPMLRADDVAAVQSAGADSHLRRGQSLEQNRQWLEAVQHYEKACRSNPEHAELKRRLLISRIHYDVVRRCQDPSLIDAMSTISSSDGLELYSEVLSRLELSYVDRVDMTEIVRGGTAYLEVALTEPRFVNQFLRGQDPNKIEQFRANIHKVALARPIRSRFEARTIVSSVAELAQNQIGLPQSAVIMQYVCGAVGMLDPYSSFLSSGELSEVESQIEGNFVGLGIALQPHEVPLRILNVIQGGPAREAGLQAGDKIVEIGNVRCTEIGAERAADLLRGPENTKVRLLVDRPERGPFELFVNRRRVEVPSIENAHIIDAAHGTAYLKVNSFQKTTLAELDSALHMLDRQNMRTLIMDLRGNPGGWLDAAVSVADRFLEDGIIVRTHGKNSIENQNYTAIRNGTWQVPLIVLIDGDSASASEIFAGAIRDHSRGVLIGTTSYGKGSVQGLFHTKSFPGGVRLTVSKFYSPSGIAISERGVTPHKVIETAPQKQLLAAKDSAASSDLRDEGGSSRNQGERLVRAKPIIGDDGVHSLEESPSVDAVLQAAIIQAAGSHLTAHVNRN
ncbi:MAG: S41 family peptidase, partial [Pirellulales bacterium]